MGISEEISSTKSNSPLGSASERTRSQTVCTASSQTITAREVKRRAISFLSSVWRGGSVSIMDLRASIWSWSRSSRLVPPTSEEYVIKSRCTARMSP